MPRRRMVPITASTRPWKACRVRVIASFDSVEHQWLLRMAHRIADPRILRLIELWLRAGALESGETQEMDRARRKERATARSLPTSSCTTSLIPGPADGVVAVHTVDVVIVRYADDFVMGFESKADAQEMLLALKERLASFGLTLHEDKTRLIEFGRFAALSCQRRGEGRPETFAFLGFTHDCGRTGDGRFIVKHKTEGKRLTRKLTALRQEVWLHARATRHATRMARRRSAWTLRLLWQTTQLSSAQRLVPGSASDIARGLRRRCQKSRRMGWSEFEILTARFPLPVPRITRTWAQARI